MQATLHIASSLTLSEAIKLLDFLNAAYLKETIYLDNKSANQITFETLGAAPSNLIKSCSLIGPIWFYGGPPCQEEWIRGMVSQYVADCILHTIVKLGERHVSAHIDAIFRFGAP